MFRLLIVDDEPVIVEGLCDYINKNCEKYELDILKAYSGDDALEILSTRKIDVVLTDIKMPGISGIDLMNNIRGNWPGCRVIFLTGYDEFDYVYEAIKNDGVKYLLKNEGYDKILKTLENEIEYVIKSQIDMELMEKAKKQAVESLPLLKKEYLYDLVNSKTAEISQEQFEALSIVLNASKPVSLLAAAVDSIDDKVNLPDNTKHIYAVRLTVERYLKDEFLYESILINDSVMICFVQPCNEGNGFRKNLRGTAEIIQNVCKNSIGTTVTVAFSTNAFNWNSLCEKISSLKMLINNRHMFGNETILTDEILLHGDYDKCLDYEILEREICSELRKCDTLEIFLKQGKKEDFFLLFKEIIESIKEHISSNSSLFYETCMRISLFYISYFNKNGITELIAKKVDMYNAFNVYGYISWDEAVNWFKRLAEIAFDVQNVRYEDRASKAMDYIKKHIKDNLSGDLSLTKLAEIVYFNPKYLSRLFKQVTGITLISYINDIKTEKAKELLKETNLKIHEIGAAIGYISAPYFTNFFKNATGMSPQDFRDYYKNK